MDDDNRRIDIDDLPKAAEELSDDEKQGVTGGTPPGGANFALSDGSVKFNTVGGSVGANKGDTVDGTRTNNV
jgi:hypothetical protein